MGCAERRGDGADLDSERLGDRSVVEVGEVPQEDRFALPVGKRRNPDSDLEWIVLGAAVPVAALDVLGGRHKGRLECGAPSLVDDDPPDPSLERCIAAKGAAMANRRDEGVLDNVASARSLSPQIATATRTKYANRAR
jgi:hypothetical protein